MDPFAGLTGWGAVYLGTLRGVPRYADVDSLGDCEFSGMARLGRGSPPPAEPYRSDLGGRAFWLERATKKTQTPDATAGGEPETLT